MKWISIVLFVVVCVSPLIECNIVYRKYQRTVPPRVKSHRKVTEVVEIFGTYNKPPFFGSSEDAINLFLRNDAPPYHRYPQRPRQPPMIRPDPFENNNGSPAASHPVNPPPSIFASRRSTTIRPNPYENNNRFMNHYPDGSVTATKFAPVPNFTIREPLTTTPEPEPSTVNVEEVEATEEVTPEYESEVIEESTTESDDYFTTEESVTEPQQEEDYYTTEESVTEPQQEEHFYNTEESATEQPEEEDHSVQVEETTTTTEEAPSPFDQEEEPQEQENDYEGNYSDDEDTEKDENRESLTEPPEEVTTQKATFWW